MKLKTFLRNTIVGVAFLATASVSKMVVAYEEPLSLNAIEYRISHEKWIDAKDAKVIISVNASLDRNQIAVFHQEVKDNLLEIADTDDWKIIEFNQNKSQSGLESVTVYAQARIDSNMLAQLNEKADKVSKVGATYRVNSIQFSPSFKQRQDALAELRAEIYTDVNKELSRVNNAFEGQPFHVNKIEFFENYVALPKGGVRMLAEANSFDAAASSSYGFAVSEQISLEARIVFANIVDIYESDSNNLERYLTLD